MEEAFWCRSRVTLAWDCTAEGWAPPLPFSLDGTALGTPRGKLAAYCEASVFRVDTLGSPQ